MTNLRKIAVVGATALAVSIGYKAFTQEDLDALLADLEGAANAAEKAAKPAQPAPKEEPKAKPVEPTPAPKVEEAPAPAPEVKPKDVIQLDSPAVPEPEVVEPVKKVEEVPVAPAPEVKPVEENPVPVKEEVAPAPKVEEAPAPAPAPEVTPVEENPTPVKEEVAPAPKVEEAPAPIVKPADVAPKFEGEDAEILSRAYATEEIRRLALKEQVKREIDEARKAMQDMEYIDAVKHYRIAQKYLTDSPDSADYRKECRHGIAEGYYRAALQEDRIGRRSRAKALMDKAVTHRHPKARRQLEAWEAADDPEANKTELGDIKHRYNAPDYQKKRTKINTHLKRARQYMATGELSKALDECELVLVDDEFNREAIALRGDIIRRQRAILKSERDVTRQGMISDVDKAWRPVYAMNARERETASAKTIKSTLGDDPERRQEQDIIRRMKEMRLPAISFKPPATIIDAVEFFRGASRDYDRPDKPLEQRGFNFYLKTPEAIQAAAPAPAAPVANDSGFGSEEDLNTTPTAPAGIPVVPTLSASDISFYDALKLVCESVQYKFKVQGPMVVVMHKNMSIDEMVTRSYPVLASFIDRVGSASSDLKEMRAAGAGGGFGSTLAPRQNQGGGGGENLERDWKEFFEMLGVKWPEGSSIMYIKTIGKLRVKNTYENLAELEKVLSELNADPRLIEIEARFVEVCQEDLNSLGFEWILNSDYSLGLGKHISRALGIRDGVFGSSSIGNGTSTEVGGATNNGNGSGSGMDQNTNTLQPEGGAVQPSKGLDLYDKSVGASWFRAGKDHNGNIGLNAIGGESTYSPGHRYLSTLGNHVSGEGVNNNDQFMRLNAFIGGADLSMILHMLSQRSDTDLLSAPKVLTRPGEEAVMKVVTEYIYPTDYDVQLQSSRSGGYDSSSQSAILAVVEPQSFTMREVGVILQATPTLTDDGNLIDLKLKADVVDEPTWKNYGMRIPFTGNASQTNFEGIGEIFTGLSSILATLGATLAPEAKEKFANTAVESASSALNALSSASNNNITYYDAPMEQPFFHVRSVDSSVSVYPGATIVMGGLITEARRAMDDKIPYLGDLPFIGRFFRSHAEQTVKRNLLIFVTTRLVDVRGREVKMNEAKDIKDAKPDVQASPASEAAVAN